MSDTGDRSYYQGEIECKDAIAEAVKDLTGVEAFYAGCCLKYLWRWKKARENPVEDLIKCRKYLDFLIEKVQSGQ